MLFPSLAPQNRANGSRHPQSPGFWASPGLSRGLQGSPIPSNWPQIPPKCSPSRPETIPKPPQTRPQAPKPTSGPAAEGVALKSATVPSGTRVACLLGGRPPFTSLSLRSLRLAHKSTSKLVLLVLVTRVCQAAFRETLFSRLWGSLGALLGALGPFWSAQGPPGGTPAPVWDHFWKDLAWIWRSVRQRKKAFTASLRKQMT